MSADTASAPPQLRPLALGEILDVAIKLVRRSFKALALAVLVVAVAIAVVEILITFSTTTYDSVLGERTAVSDAAAVAAGFVSLVLFLVLYVIATVACFGAIADAYIGRRPDWRASLRFAARRAGSTMWLGILMAIGLTLAFVALIVPYFYFAVAWSVAFPVMLLEGVGGTKAMRRSFRLVRGSWWKTFGTLFVAYALTFLLSALGGALVGAIVGAAVGNGSALAVVLQQIVDIGVQVVTLPFFAAVLIVLYVDLRVRKEGFDLALMADHIAHPDRAASWTPSAPAPAPAPELAGAEPAPELAGAERTDAERTDGEPPRHPAFGE
jgi:hypothetical protein